MQRHERERSTRHPVRSILALMMPEVLDLVENSDQPRRRREWQMKQFKSTGQAQRFLTAHDQINNLFHLRRYHVTAAEYRVRAEIGGSAAITI
jgi:hypothetical protein